jgi:hypothetical protein
VLKQLLLHIRLALQACIAPLVARSRPDYFTPAQNYIFPDTDIILYADEDGSRAEEGNPED